MITRLKSKTMTVLVVLVKFNLLKINNLTNLINEKKCYKSLQNPTYVDLFLTNCNKSFQHTKAISTGLSDCHKMIITVLKTTFKKAKPNEKNIVVINTSIKLNSEII